MRSSRGVLARLRDLAASSALAQRTSGSEDAARPPVEISGSGEATRALKEPEHSPKREPAGPLTNSIERRLAGGHRVLYLPEPLLVSLTMRATRAMTKAAVMTTPRPTPAAFDRERIKRRDIKRNSCVFQSATARWHTLLRQPCCLRACRICARAACLSQFRSAIPKSRRGE